MPVWFFKTSFNKLLPVKNILKEYQLLADQRFEEIKSSVSLRPTSAQNTAESSNESSNLGMETAQLIQSEEAQPPLDHQTIDHGSETIVFSETSPNIFAVWKNGIVIGTVENNRGQFTAKSIHRTYTKAVDSRDNGIRWIFKLHPS